MSYSDFQQYCASNGFINTPITDQEYWTLIGNGLQMYYIYSVACDVNAGFSFQEAMQESIKAMESDKS
jgi:hypothetical protein